MKNIAPFTNNELKIIKGSFGLLAKKHRVSRTYVRMLANGERQAKSKTAGKILKDLRFILDVLRPIVINKSHTGYHQNRESRKLSHTSSG